MLNHNKKTIYSVLQLTDIHIVNDSKKDRNTYKTVDAVINTAKPDMIVITGDITSKKENMTAFGSFCPFMESYNIPWAFTFGNHEGVDLLPKDKPFKNTEQIVDRDTLNKYLENLDNCIYTRGNSDTDGTGNYYHIIRDSSNKAVMALIMMDSNSQTYEGKKVIYDCFTDNQVRWYKNIIKEIALKENGNEENVIPSLMFFHIPLKAFKEGYCKKNKLMGHRLEKTCCPRDDDGMFEAIKEMKSTKGVFVGHDHMNNYSIMYEGVRLTYGTTCDYNIYNVPYHGGKLIKIKNDGTFTVTEIKYFPAFNKIKIGKEI